MNTSGKSTLARWFPLIAFAAIAADPVSGWRSTITSA